MNNYIYLIIGESGVGKTSIVNYLCSKYELKSINSYTTRIPRYEGEQGHIFVTKQEFDQLKDICAYVQYNNNEYAATLEQVQESDLYIVDPKGATYFKEYYTGEKIPIYIYLHASSNIRYERMAERGDDEIKIKERLINDIKAFKTLTYDIRIETDNKSIKEVGEELYRIIKSGE